MTRRALAGLLGGTALILMPLPALAGPAQSRSVGDGGGGPAPTNSVPPVAATAPERSEVGKGVDGLSDVNTVTNVLHDAAGAIGERKGLIDKTMAGQSKQLFEGKSKIIEKVSNVVTVGEMAQKTMNGDTAGAIHQGAAKFADQVIDKCYSAASAAVCAYVSAPTGEAAFPACETAAAAIKFCADKVIEDKFGGSLGELTVKGVEAAYDKVSAMFADKQAEQRQQTQAQQAQLANVRATNEQQAIAQANAQAAAAASSNSGDDGSAFANALMSGLMVMSAEQQRMQPPPIPMAPPPAPPPVPRAMPQAAPAPAPAPISMPLAVAPQPAAPPRSIASVSQPTKPPASTIGPPLPTYRPPPAVPIGGPCHAGHDEKAHPGGCHKGSGTSK